MDEVKQKFHALTPIDNADLGVYESALDFVFSKKDVKNIAVSGAYGAGKSSVIESYKRKNTDKSFLHISLTRFRPETEDALDANSIETMAMSETVLEGKILNQLIHQIPPENIPLTNFRVKKGSSKTRNIWTSLFAVSGVALGVFVLNFSRWTSFVSGFETAWLSCLLGYTTSTEARFIALLGLSLLVGIFAYRIVKMQESHKLIKKANVSGVEIELFGDSSDSYFDKYLNEVLYLFKNVKEDAIVFEDIDRYDSSRIFERLHEINRLVNNDRKNKSPLRFFFLLKDDIFVSKDRTKFFDFIMPVVPIVDGSNSFDIFLECFENVGIEVDDKGDGKLNTEFLQGISLYIDDMRLLQNICNEFSIYHGRISNTEQDENKMFALIAYKNLFPRDFAELQLAQGFMFEIIGGRGKDNLLKSERLRINNAINLKIEELEKVKAEFLVVDELAIIYGQKIFGINHNHRDWGADEYRQHIETRRGRNNLDIIADYDNRVAHAESNADSKNNRIIRIENEIRKLNGEKIALAEKVMRTLLTRGNIDVFFKDTIFTSETDDTELFKGIKDSPYFAMLKFLVREGYIDETYSDYMTYFREKSVKRTDKIFLRSVTDKKAKEKSYKLENPNLVVSRLPLVYFNQDEIMNFDLFHFLLCDYLAGKTHLLKTKRLVKHIQDNQLHDFIMGYASYVDDLDCFVKVIGLEWTGFLSDYFEYFNIKGAPVNKGSINDDFIRRFALKLLMLVGANSKRVSFVDEDSKISLVNYVSHDIIFLRTDTPNVAELASGIKQFDIKFNVICLEFDVDVGTVADRIIAEHYTAIQDELLTMIYENNSYAINYENILVLLEKFYDSPDITIVPTSGYTVVMSDKESPLAKYLNANIDEFMGIVLKYCNEVIADAESYAISIINNKRIDDDKRKVYISYLNTVVADILEIENTELWSGLLNNHKALKYTADNVVAYFVNCCDKTFDTALIGYVNAKGTSITLESGFADDNQKREFFRALIRACTLNNTIYEGYLSQLNFRYDNFEIEGLTIEKLAIIDKLNKIGMSATSLATMREHYSKYLYNFICNHIEDYLRIVLKDGVFVFNEMLELLDKELEVNHKIELITHTNETISLKNKKYPDKLFAYIVNSDNYDATNFEYLIKNYDGLGQESKSAVLIKAIQQVSLLQTMLNSATPMLVTDVLSSENITNETKQDIFRIIALNAKDSDVKKWLGMIGLDVFLDVYDKNKRPKFEDNDINTAMLEIFKKRSDITDYVLDEGSGKYKIRRGGLFSSLSEHLL